MTAAHWRSTMADQDLTDEELFAELEEAGENPIQSVVDLNSLEDKEISDQRLTKCLSCPHMKKLKCTNNWQLIHIMARQKNAVCPIGEW